MSEWIKMTDQEPLGDGFLMIHMRDRNDYHRSRPIFKNAFYSSDL